MALEQVLSTIVKRLRSLELWRDSLREPTNSTCILRKDASQSFADGVAAAVTFGAGTEIRDLDGLHSTALNTERITAVVAGVYVITGTVMWEGNKAGDRELGLYQNGGITLDLHTHLPADTLSGMNVTAHALLAVGDYIWMEALQTSGGALNVLYARLGATRIA